MTDRMKLLDLKLKEIKAIDDKMFKLRSGNFKRSLKKIVSRSKKLKLALKKEKNLVGKILKSIMKKQKKLLRVLSIHDKEFTEKNHGNLNKMLTKINLSLKSYMKFPFFKKVYHEFISFFLKKVKEFSEKSLKNPDNTVRKFIKKYWVIFNYI